MQAARTRSFAILCNLVMNATCDRCVWYVDCSSDRVLSVAVQCYVVTSLSAPGEHPSRRPASPSMAEGAVGWTTVQGRSAREAGFAMPALDWQGSHAVAAPRAAFLHS